MSEPAGERTQDATPKKRADAAREGDVLRSRDLAAAAVLAGFMGWATITGGWVAAGSAVVARGLAVDHRALETHDWSEAIVQAAAPALVPMAVLAAALLLAIAVSAAVLGPVAFNWGAAKPKGSRIDPVKGLGRLVKADALADIGLSLAKVTVLIVIGAAMLWGGRGAIVQLARLSPEASSAASARMLVETGWWLTGAMVAIGLLDALVQRRRREARLKMSLQEVREEHRQSEGAPERKRAQRERQYAIAAGSARKAMTEASVVLVNPKHFAVALRYRPAVDAVPVVVAKGVDEAARAIRDLAAIHGVPTLDSALLARAIYYTGRVGQPVRSELYLAVATVLAFVFDLEAVMAARRRVPEVEVPDGFRFDAAGRPAAR